MLSSSHFREVSGHPDTYMVVDAIPDAACEALAALPAGFYITFYDASAPVGSGDPGTYFSMRRKGAGWQVTGGNHGWSHGVAEISDDEAKRFLAFCLPSNRGPEPNCIAFVKDDFPGHWEVPWSGTALTKRIRKIANDDGGHGLC